MGDVLPKRTSTHFGLSLDLFVRNKIQLAKSLNSGGRLLNLHHTSDRPIVEFGPMARVPEWKDLIPDNAASAYIIPPAKVGPAGSELCSFAKHLH